MELFDGNDFFVSLIQSRHSILIASEPKRLTFFPSDPYYDISYKRSGLAHLKTYFYGFSVISRIEKL